jgi:hypothetical protein
MCSTKAEKRRRERAYSFKEAFLERARTPSKAPALSLKGVASSR